MDNRNLVIPLRVGMCDCESCVSAVGKIGEIREYLSQNAVEVLCFSINKLATFYEKDVVPATELTKLLYD